MDFQPIGIDFGACNIKAAYFNLKNNRPMPLKLNTTQTAGKETPNVLLYECIDDDEVQKIIGHVAKKSFDYPNRITDVKRKLERNDGKYIPCLDRLVSPREAARDIFGCIDQLVKNNLTTVTNPLGAAITVPVCFSAAQKNSVRQAAIEAGIPVKAIITEPFAALFAVDDFFAPNAKNEVVFIFDFGGSTLDLSLLRLKHNGNDLLIEELAAAGQLYGGIDIDRQIYAEILSTKYGDELEEILANAEANKGAAGKERATAEIFDTAVLLKENLFAEYGQAKTNYGFNYHGDGIRRKFELTLAEVEDMFVRHGIKDKIIGLIDELFAQTAEVMKKDVTCVKVFGGTARIKFFLNLLEEYFGADLFDGEEYFEEQMEDEDSITSVASGAARYLHLCAVGGVEIRCKIPFSIGLAKGNRFVKYLDCQPPYGRASKNIVLKWADLEKNDYRLPIYQSLADAHNLTIDGENGAVYVGSVALTPELYEIKDAVGAVMRMTEPGKLAIVFREQKADKKVTKVEEKVLQIGED